ncbi:sensor histidine kinase [Nocardia harenae]|uniref:sensor histidine kinase n=1 Tax=Nocardia harenae TaxID=358707 RepID=UPI000B2E4D19|nr:HAMP domain-containing sensor histidine kinase [Nocardia harenae]
MSRVPVAKARGALGARLSAIPLRVGLVLALVLLCAAGLGASGMLVTSALERSLLNRTDQQLREAALSWARPDRLVGPLPADGRQPPSPFFVEVERPDDPARLVLRPFNIDATPALPQPPIGRPVTVGSSDSAEVEWRVLSLRTRDGTTTVAAPLTQNRDTVDQLIMLLMVVGVLVLVALGVAAYFVIDRSLRPLRDVERTAAAIAAGDLHRRVPQQSTKTEVGRLSRSLNGMLAQIQRAFEARTASEEAARHSEERMRRFVADASHELRTPLTTIRGFAELFRQGATSDPALVMARIEREAQRMGLLVEDLLMLARMDADRPLDLAPVDLLTLASDAVHSARVLAGAGAEHTIELAVRPGTGTLEVLGDDTRLRQVLSNLLSNAMVHTPAGTTVTVRLTPAADEVLIEVADTGPGLPAEEAERIFERFYRTDSSRTRASGGTGLGLSIVRALVTAHGGTVTAASEPGRGTTFTVRLPRDLTPG